MVDTHRHHLRCKRLWAYTLTHVSGGEISVLTTANNTEFIMGDTHVDRWIKSILKSLPQHLPAVHVTQTPDVTIRKNYSGGFQLLGENDKNQT